jgi:hypothetical protein
MTGPYMRDHGKHHRVDVDEGRYLHYPDTCNVYDVDEIRSDQPPWLPRSTALAETRLAHSRLGLVAICYETKGVMTFFVQLNEKRAAWQRIEWPTGFDHNWDEKKFREAIDHFLWVAECEDKRQSLPRTK